MLYLACTQGCSRSSHRDLAGWPTAVPLSTAPCPSQAMRQEGRLLHTFVMPPSKLTVGAPILEASQAYNPGITCFFLLSCWHETHKLFEFKAWKIYTYETDKCQCPPLPYLTLPYRVWLCPSFMVLAIEKMLWPYRKSLY